MKLPLSKSLHFRFSTWILLGVIIPALGGITCASFYASSIISEKIAKNLKLEAKLLKNEVSQWTETNTLTGNSLSLSSQIEDIDISNAGYGLVLNESNQLIASSDSVTSSEIDLQNFSDYLSAQDIKEKDYLFIKDKAGVEWISQGIRLDNGWSVIVLQEAKEAFLPIRQLWFATGAIAFIVTLLTAIIVRLITKRVLKPLQVMSIVADRISQGDLKQKIPILSQDELGTIANALNTTAQKLESASIELQAQYEIQAKQLEEKETSTTVPTVERAEIVAITNSHNQTIESLNQIIAQVENISKSIANTTNHNQEGIAQLSANTIQQNQAIVAVLNQVQTMAESMASVAQNAAEAEKSIKQATEKVKQEDLAINNTVERIVSLGESTAAAKEQVQKLKLASRKISKAVDLIRKIALQTNVLAVNASIEAARAGEEGMGFTVVADEVQSLATRSAKTATDIEKLVIEIQGETSKVIKVIDRSNQEIMAGSKLMQKTRESLQEVTNASIEIDRLIEDISKQATEQSENSKSVTATMEEAAAAASKTSESAIDVSTFFKELQQVTEELKSSVNKFQDVKS